MPYRDPVSFKYTQQICQVGTGRIRGQMSPQPRPQMLPTDQATVYPFLIGDPTEKSLADQSYAFNLASQKKGQGHIEPITQAGHGMVTNHTVQAMALFRIVTHPGINWDHDCLTSVIKHELLLLLLFLLSFYGDGMDDGEAESDDDNNVQVPSNPIVRPYGPRGPWGGHLPQGPRDPHDQWFLSS